MQIRDQIVKIADIKDDIQNAINFPENTDHRVGSVFAEYAPAIAAIVKDLQDKATNARSDQDKLIKELEEELDRILM